MLDTDIFFNGNIIHSALKKIKEKKLDILGVNTLSYPYPWFYDFLPFKNNNKINNTLEIIKQGFKFLIPYEKIMNVESYFCGFMIFKKNVLNNNKINYEFSKNSCEHLSFNEKILQEGYKISIINNITPIFEGLFSYEDEEKKLYKNIFNLIKNEKKDLRWSMPVTIYLYYFVIIFCIIIFLYKLY